MDSAFESDATLSTGREGRGSIRTAGGAAGKALLKAQPRRACAQGWVPAPRSVGGAGNKEVQGSERFRIRVLGQAVF